MPEERIIKFKPVDPQTTDARVLSFIQTRVIAAKLDQLRREEPKPRTYVINPKSPVGIRGVYEVVNVRGSGRLDELLVRGSAKFTLGMEVDGQVIYYDTYDQLEDLSQQSDEISAFQDAEGNYVVHLEELKFAESLRLTLHGTFTASRLFCKYELVPRLKLQVRGH